MFRGDFFDFFVVGYVIVYPPIFSKLIADAGFVVSGPNSGKRCLIVKFVIIDTIYVNKLLVSLGINI